MGYIELTDVHYALPGGRALLEGLSLRAPTGSHMALVGANGVGKTTVLRLIAGEERPQIGAVKVEGRFGFMRQFVGSFAPDATIRDFLVALAPQAVRKADARLQRAELIIKGPHGQNAQMAYADALVTWGEIGGYEIEVLWEACCQVALHKPLSKMAGRKLQTLSGGEQKRLALEAFLRSDVEVLLLDEPDNFLDVPGKGWLEKVLNESKKTILYITHDRALLANTAHAVTTIEGRSAWTHHGPYSEYNDARRRRLERIEEEHRLFATEQARIRAQIKEFKRRAALNDKFASKARSAEKKLERFEVSHAPRSRPAQQSVRMDLGGGRSGKIALRLEKLAITGLLTPFDAEIWFGERVGIIGANGTGKSHLMRLLAGEPIAHEGTFKLGARVQPALFSQLHDRLDIDPEDQILDVLKERGMETGRSMSLLKRYELQQAATTPFSLLSGGQQARLQILLMELKSSTMLLLDEPTDNLDIDSAEAFEEALLRYEGTVLVVTHDRFFMRLLDRFLVFGEDGSVRESLEAGADAAVGRGVTG